MPLFGRKQGLVSTMNAMARFSEADRALGMDMLECAEGVFVRLGSPSRLGTAILNVALRGQGIDEADKLYGVLLGPVMMGYACRMGLFSATHLPDSTADALLRELVFTDNNTLNYDALTEAPGAFVRVADLAGSLADDRATIAVLARASEDVWDAFSTMATYQFHKNLAKNKRVRGIQLPPHEILESLLRLGYAIRLVDEVAGEQPADRQGRVSAPTAPIDIDEWLSDTTTLCISNFEPFAEQLLQLATLERLDIVSVVDALLGERPTEDLGEDVTAALSNVRLGYALRHREVQLLGQSDYIAPGDAMAILLTERTRSDTAMNMAVVHGVLRDILTLKLLPARISLYDTTPGTTPELRRQVMEQWAADHFPSDDPRAGHDVTVDLIEYGYFAYRLFEIRPDCLEDWPVEE